MLGITAKTVTTIYGDLSYYRLKSEKNHKNSDILFIHGLGGDKSWFLEQCEHFSLEKYSWIVPDLLGYGSSAKPREKYAYFMDQQAKYLVKVLKEEQVKSIIILAHSMGGPIAISLIEQLKEQDEIKIRGLLYLEGNLDINDAFFSSEIANKSFDEFESQFEPWTEYVEAYPVWASSLDLVNVSDSNQLLIRLQRCLTFPVHFIFGEKNKGRFTSEKLVEESGLSLKFIPNTGHFMHMENPSDFWNLVIDIIQIL